jgi:maltose/moltooligosaccharide transporter
MIGAILSSIALVLMPNCSELWMAAGLLWILDSSINISMEPFRAFVADNLPEEQRTFGFSMQSLFIGLGSVVASALPWIFTNWVGMKDEVGHVGIPSNVKWSFYIGACAFFLFVLYTVVTSKEYPPVVDKKQAEKKKVGVMEGLNEIVDAIMNMPKRMKQLALVQFLTWPGLFLMWFYYTPAVGADIFGGSAADTSDPALRTLYQQGTELAGLTYSFQNLITFLFAMFLPILAKPLGQKFTHQLCLTVGGFGLISLSFIHGAQNQIFLFAVMGAVGIAWASILSMPYAMLADCLPENKIGVYMGIFNFFIVLPEIIAALSFGWVMETFLDNNRVLAVSIGGGLLILAGILTMRISDSKNS